MPQVLTIEDDEITAREIVAELNSHSIDVEWVTSGREGLAKALHAGYDAITLDRMLPDIDGLEIVTAMRTAGVQTPVLMISALSDVDDRIRGLRAGGDDYLIKPFASDEMAARVEVLLRRQRAAVVHQSLKLADLEIDLMSRSVRRNGRELSLLPTEFKLLEFMLRNSGQVLTRNMMFEAVWGYHFDPGTNLIDVHIGRLRRKIDLPGLLPLVRTVRGSGYRLSDER